MLFPSTLIIKLQDGLGNQLFQYAHGVALSRKPCLPLRFDDRFFFHRADHATYATPRRYALDSFVAEVSMADASLGAPVGIRQSVAVDQRKKSAAHRGRQASDRAWRCCGIPGIGATERHSMRWEMSCAKAWRSARPLRRNERIGWQGHAGANETRWASRSWCMCGGGTTSATRCTMCGDLKRVLPRGHAFYVGGKFPAWRFIVFSEDIAWCREAFKEIAPSAWFHQPGDEREDFRLMSLCRHHILPNSTFSWWAAWLAKCDGQRVYCPDRWYTDPARSDRATCGGLGV